MIKILCVGKIKEAYLRDAINEYQKRLTKYTKLEIKEGMDSNKKQEKDYYKKHIQEKDFVITLEIEGKEYDSIQFSKELEKIEMKNSNIVFIIGGSEGLDEEIKNRSNLKLSFSKMTFPHQLFRLILLEQLYRAYKIRNNETYHK